MGVSRLIRSRAALWVGFALVHGWLTLLGVVVAPGSSFHDIDLYRWWMHLGLAEGQWPVLDGPWVYPAGAVAPMLLPAAVTTVSTAGYALAWCFLVTLLDGLATAALLRERPDGSRTTTGTWWWLAFLVALGPVALGRLDGIVVPLMVLALLAGVGRPRLAAALMTVGAWIKVAPGALLLPLVAAVRRPVRDVVVPALVVCGVVVGAVTAGGGIGNIASFLTVQTARGLQVESVTATPWVVASLWRDDVVIRLNDVLITWEVVGPGTTTAAAALDMALALAMGLVAGLLWWARTQGRSVAALVPGAFLTLIVLVVVNKVGSPQLLAWPAAPVAVMVGRPAAAGARWLRALATTTLAAAALTQVVFPWGYLRLLSGSGSITAILVLRNVLLVALVVLAVVGLLRAARPDDSDDAPDDRPEAVQGGGG